MENIKFQRMGRDEYFTKVAYLTGLRGTCGRLRVGIIAVKDNRQIASGYNGALPGDPHCGNTICDMSQACTRTIHAEQNMIYFAAKHGISLEGATCFVTHSPCSVCARALIMAGVRKLYYAKKYRDTTGLEILSSHNVELVNLSHEDAIS